MIIARLEGDVVRNRTISSIEDITDFAKLMMEEFILHTETKTEEEMKEDLKKELLNDGDFCDKVIGNYLADTEFSSIDEMTERIDELERENSDMRDDFLCIEQHIANWT